MIGPVPKPEIERFMNFIEKSPLGCWNWKGASNKKYGTFRIGSQHNGTRKQEYAHRWSYKHFIGEIDSGLFVCHKCDNKLCVNPDHLFLGTNSENILDAVAKGVKIGSPNYGERNGNSKLTADNVLEIRKLSNQNISLRKIGKIFGISGTHVDYIVKNKNWSHI